MEFARAALVAVFALTVAGCDRSGTCGGGCPDVRDADATDSDAQQRSIVSVTVTPPSVDLTIEVSTPPATLPTATFTATATYNDGTSGPATGEWSILPVDIGSVDSMTGGFTANGVRGGTASVRLTARSGAIGMATVHVTLTASLAPAAGSPGSDAAAAFASAGAPVTDASAQIAVLYPLDGVMFPQNIAAPETQWSGGVAGDFYRLTYAKPDVRIVQYVANTGGAFTYSASVPNALFSHFAETDPGTAGTLTIDRLQSPGMPTARVISGTPITMRFAPGSVSGAVYYWSMDEGHLRRITTATNTNQSMFPAPVVGTSTSTPAGYSFPGCIACHQISRDGRYLVASGDDIPNTVGIGLVFDLTAGDPTAPNYPASFTMGAGGAYWLFATISPDDRRILGTSLTNTFVYTDLTAHAVTPSGVPLATSGVTQPSWSPDGNSIVHISNAVDSGNCANYTNGDLTVVPVTAPDTFGMPAVIQTGTGLASADPAGGNDISFPTWSPDSRFVVYAHGPTSRGTTTGSCAGSPAGSLFIQPPHAATPTRLAHASDVGMLPRALYPAMSPFTSGGHYWVLFYSYRPYGNAQVGTLGREHPQLWVSAISTSYDGTSDPSEVPYWLPGQEVNHINADAVWAASPCRGMGTACSTSSDCCSGSCLAGASGALECRPSMACRREGESCGTTADCCGEPLVCDPQIHTCQGPPG